MRWRHALISVIFYWQLVVNAASLLLKMWADAVCFSIKNADFSRPIHYLLNPDLWNGHELAMSVLLNCWFFCPYTWKPLLRNPPDDSEACFNLHRGQCGEQTRLLLWKKFLSLFPFFSTAEFSRVFLIVRSRHSSHGFLWYVHNTQNVLPHIFWRFYVSSLFEWESLTHL